MMSKLLLIPFVMVIANITMTADFVTLRPELWQVFAELLAVFGICVSIAWYQYRANRFYIVVRVGGN